MNLHSVSNKISFKSGRFISKNKGNSRELFLLETCERALLYNVNHSFVTINRNHQVITLLRH